MMVKIVSPVWERVSQMMLTEQRPMSPSPRPILAGQANISIGQKLVVSTCNPIYQSIRNSGLFHVITSKTSKQIELESLGWPGYVRRQLRLEVAKRFKIG